MSGYARFLRVARLEAENLLIDSEESRTFKDRKGDVIYIDPTTFENGVPSFANTTQKCASMWWELAPAERHEWILNH